MTTQLHQQHLGIEEIIFMTHTEFASVGVIGMLWQLVGSSDVERASVKNDN